MLCPSQPIPPPPPPPYTYTKMTLRPLGYGKPSSFYIKQHPSKNPGEAILSKKISPIPPPPPHPPTMTLTPLGYGKPSPFYIKQHPFRCIGNSSRGSNTLQENFCLQLSCGLLLKWRICSLEEHILVFTKAHNLEELGKSSVNAKLHMVNPERYRCTSIHHKVHNKE